MQMKNRLINLQKNEKKPLEGRVFNPLIHSTRAETGSLSALLSTSPRNFKFFGQLRNSQGTGIIHSTPQSAKSSSTGFSTFTPKSKTYYETKFSELNYQKEASDSMNERTDNFKNYGNLEVLLKENDLFTIHEQPQTKKVRNATASNDLRNLPAFRNILSRANNFSQRQNVNSANTTSGNRGGMGHSNGFEFQNLAQKKRIQTSSAIPRKTKMDKDFYSLDTVGYRNYKYPKVAETPSARRKRIFIQPSFHRETIESCIQNIHNQKILLENLRVQEEMYPFGVERILEEGSTSSKINDDQSENSPKMNKRNKLDPIHTNKRFPQDDGLFEEADALRNEKDRNHTPLKRKFRLDNSKDKEGLASGLIKKEFSPDLKKIIVNKKQSFNTKHIKMEFEHFSNISAKYLENIKQKIVDGSLEEDSSNSADAEFLKYQIDHAMKEKGICIQILAETPDFPKHQKKAIINRVLLALDVNLTNEFPILNFAQFQTLKKAIIYRDLPNAEMTEFVIKFFKLGEANLSVQLFLRVLRGLTEKIDADTKQPIESNGLYETFVENYKLIGILKVEEEYVDFNRFRQVYLFNKMNILDLIDLISGVN